MEFNTKKKPLIIAHRGLKAKYPENTMAAFKAALDLGVTMIELDVTLTLDREVVVIHDKTLERTSSGSGSVRDWLWEDLRKLDAGSWFSPRFNGEKIPSLEEVLSLCAGRVQVNVEIKPEAFEEQNPADAIEIKVLDLVETFAMTDSVLISCFEPRVIQRIEAMKRRKPKTAFLSEDPLDNAMVDFMVRHGVSAYNPDHRTLEKNHVETVHNLGIQVFTYTVNTKEDAGRCFAMGVDGIFTDDPTLFS